MTEAAPSIKTDKTIKRTTLLTVCNSTAGRIRGEKKVCRICGVEFEPTGRKGQQQYRTFCYDCLPFGSKRAMSATRRALKRVLVNYKGGKCEICGYDKCMDALQFHHPDSNKEFSISQVRVTANIDLDAIKREVDKTELVCSNCHAELHAKDELS